MRGKNILKGAGATILGIGAFLGFIVLAIFFIIVFVKGATYLSTTVEPFLNKISVPLFLISVFVLLPLTFFRKTRSFGSGSLYIGSYVFGLLAWLIGFIATYYYLGIGWVIFGFFFLGIGVVPFGVIAGFTHHRADIGWSLLVLIAIAYGIRLYATWQLENAEHEDYTPHNPWKTATIALSLVILALAGTGVWYRNTHYTASFESSFLSSCESQGASADACGCVLGVVKANYTYAQVKAIDTLGEAPQSLKDKVSNQCNSGQ